MGLLEELRSRARTMSREAFASTCKGFYLLGTIPAVQDDEWSFTTDVRMFDGRPAGGPRQQAAPPPETVLWRVEKSDRNAWARRISVGRAPNNDIVIRHDSVSKLHAHFQLGSMISKVLFRSAELLLSDVGTANGTALNGRRLPEGEAAPVASGDRVQFGRVQGVVLAAGDLHGALRSLPG